MKIRPNLLHFMPDFRLAQTSHLKSDNRGLGKSPSSVDDLPPPSSLAPDEFNDLKTIIFANEKLLRN